MKVHHNCCGLDVHKQTNRSVFDLADIDGSTRKEKRIFGTMTQHLRELAQWLVEAKVSGVAMEATGVYWVPVWNVLEGAGLRLVLINPEHYRAVRGKKTDLKDGERIAELLQDGRLEGGYVPPTELRVLRDLTRYRSKLVEHQSSIACRIQKLLEQCNIKLGSVASNVLGVSGTAMLHALAQGMRSSINSCRLLASSEFPAIPSRGTTQATALRSSSMSFWKTTAASKTAGCSINTCSISIGLTQTPLTFIMSSTRPAYPKNPSSS